MTMRVLSGATTDALTHCYLKDHMLSALRQLKEEADTAKKSLSLLILDVDHFKSFNDKHGHLHGDEVLKYFSSSLHLNLVDVDNLPFRFGGDEFVVLFPGKSSDTCLRLAEMIQKNIRSRMFLLKGKQYLMSFSGGIATYPDDAKSVEELLQKADKALYCSKKNGRARTTLYSRITVERTKYYLMIAAILAALALVLYFNRGKFSGLLSRLRMTQVTFHSANPSQPGSAAPTTVPLLSPQSPLLDEIYLRSGDRIVGRIVLETPAEIRINMKLDQGEATVSIQRSEIVKMGKVEG